jgi:hypothetical protein
LSSDPAKRRKLTYEGLNRGCISLIGSYLSAFTAIFKPVESEKTQKTKRGQTCSPTKNIML